MSVHQVKLNLPPAEDGSLFTPAAAESLVGTATTFDGCPGTILKAFCMKDGSSIHVTIEYERPES